MISIFIVSSALDENFTSTPVILFFRYFLFTVFLLFIFFTQKPEAFISFRMLFVPSFIQLVFYFNIPFSLRRFFFIFQSSRKRRSSRGGLTEFTRTLDTNTPQPGGTTPSRTNAGSLDFLFNQNWLTLLYFWRCAVLYCTVLYCTLPYCAVLYCTILCCTVLYCIVMYCTVLYCIVLYCTVLYCTVLYYTVLYCTVLYSTV